MAPDAQGWKMIGKASALTLFLLSGCATVTETRLVCPDIPETVRPSLPAIQARELACLTDEAYERLLERDRQRREYAQDQEAILAGIREECERIESGE